MSTDLVEDEYIIGNIKLSILMPSLGWARQGVGLSSKLYLYKVHEHRALLVYLEMAFPNKRRSHKHSGASYFHEVITDHS